jgi:hypothetical protein
MSFLFCNNMYKFVTYFFVQGRYLIDLLLLFLWEKNCFVTDMILAPI